VVHGPGGAGKNTLIRALVAARDDVSFAVSATTRPARPGEIDGRDYHFVSHERFQQMVDDGAFLEWAEFNGQRYGTPWSSLAEIMSGGRIAVLDIEMQGVEQVRSRYPDAVLVFVKPSSVEQLAQRLRERGGADAEAIARRMAIARRQLETEAARFDHVVVNDDLDTAVAAISRILDKMPAI
jgi:guanylate kinase